MYIVTWEPSERSIVILFLPESLGILAKQKCLAPTKDDDDHAMKLIIVSICNSILYRG